MTDLLNVVDLSIAFGTGERPVVEGLSFEIAPGESLGLVGASGSGKSLTAAALLGLLPAGAQVQGGHAAFMQKSGTAVNLFELSHRECIRLRGREIGLVFQETQAALNPVFRCGCQLREAVRRLQPEVSDREAFLEELLQRVELASIRTRVLRSLPSELSGGELQRILIAMALIGRPRLLIADEPTTALDSITEAEMVRLLDRLRRELNMGMLFITHDTRLLSRVTDRIMRIGPPPPPRRTSIRSAVTLTGTSLVEVSGLTVCYPETEEPAVVDCSIKIGEGEWLALIGPSGCGKTTLAHWFAGLLTGRSGTLNVGDRTLPVASPGRLVRQLTGAQIIFQDVSGSLNPEMTVGDALREVTKLWRSGDPAEYLRRVNLPPDKFLHRYPNQLSGGERQRIVIARALAAKPRMLICDEAVASLDLPLREDIQQLLSEIATRDQIGILFITHDLHQVASFADRVLVMEHGRIVEEGKPIDILKNPTTSVGKRLVAAARLHDGDGGEPKIARAAL
ncbi:peptide/nickel transport system ATP-binding protein [Lewinella aquimaris]|uniref:Peptide/nickel transport system ATP-binding protein n=1 Tax=Neolewinella aquimaris TaxID=1835722 RepID=A0A840E6Q9_9BACT|nr:ATP-binding cassette domain-containing protein [Neolewinella aquimaris]MBB4077778.1 peptide/nickel transport system ATP-binding protein [Neolewinella aquimaris]